MFPRHAFQLAQLAISALIWSLYEIPLFQFIFGPEALPEPELPDGGGEVAVEVAGTATSAAEEVIVIIVVGADA